MNAGVQSATKLSIDRHILDGTQSDVADLKRRDRAARAKH